MEYHQGKVTKFSGNLRALFDGTAPGLLVIVGQFLEDSHLVVPGYALAEDTGGDAGGHQVKGTRQEDDISASIL